MMKLFLALALSFFLLAPQSAAAAAPAMVEAARKEGALVFYTTMDIQNSKPLVDEFNKKYPFIRADLVRHRGTAMVSRIMTEAQAGANRFDVALGISRSSPSDMPKAWAIRIVTARVGLACSRSIWLNMERLTPLAPASASRDHPRLVRSCFTRPPR